MGNSLRGRLDVLLCVKSRGIRGAGVARRNNIWLITVKGNPLRGGAEPADTLHIGIHYSPPSPSLIFEEIEINNRINELRGMFIRPKVIFEHKKIF